MGDVTLDRGKISLLIQNIIKHIRIYVAFNKFFIIIRIYGTFLAKLMKTAAYIISYWNLNKKYFDFYAMSICTCS